MKPNTRPWAWTSLRGARHAEFHPPPPGSALGFRDDRARGGVGGQDLDLPERGVGFWTRDLREDPGGGVWVGDLLGWSGGDGGQDLVFSQVRVGEGLRIDQREGEHPPEIENGTEDPGPQRPFDLDRGRFQVSQRVFDPNRGRFQVSQRACDPERGRFWVSQRVFDPDRGRFQASQCVFDLDRGRFRVSQRIWARRGRSGAGSKGLVGSADVRSGVEERAGARRR